MKTILAVFIALLGSSSAYPTGPTTAGSQNEVLAPTPATSPKLNPLANKAEEGRENARSFFHSPIIPAGTVPIGESGLGIGGLAFPGFGGAGVGGFGHGFGIPDFGGFVNGFALPHLGGFGVPGHGGSVNAFGLPEIGQFGGVVHGGNGFRLATPDDFPSAGPGGYGQPSALAGSPHRFFL